MIKNNSIKVVLVISIFISIIGCNNNSKFEIEKGKVGLISSITTIKELKNIFKNDSIVINLSEGALGNSYFQDDDKYLIFEKGGNHLLTIVPKEQLDSTSTFKSIEVHDPRYTTKSGLNLNSNFSQVNATNKVRVESTLQSVTLFLDDLNATMTIDKEELGLSDFSIQKVSIEQIPDLAKIKSFVVWFD